MRSKSASNLAPTVSTATGKLCSLPYQSRPCYILTCLAAKEEFDFFFAENGLVAYKEAQVLAIQSLKTWLGEDKLKELINFLLHYIADLDIPIKRGTFIEFRNGMLNVCPIGRNCSQAERDEFEQFDHGAGVRSDSPLCLHCCFARLAQFMARLTAQRCLWYSISPLSSTIYCVPVAVQSADMVMHTTFVQEKVC